MGEQDFSTFTNFTDSSDWSKRIGSAISEIRSKCRSATTEKSDLLLYAFDATKRTHLPDCVVFPEGAEEVSAVMKICSKYKIPVTPRGAGTGFAGGAVPISGGVVLVFTKMNRILNLNRESLFVEVEPGIVNAELGALLAKEGLFYPPDPASLKSSTIGGNVSTGAGGPSAVKYGVTADYVMGLTAILPNGDIIETGIKTEKGVVGYNLTKLLVGSEGTLGVITKIRLKVVPIPEKVFTSAVFFPGRREATDAAILILQKGIRPRTLEYIDKTALNCVTEFTGLVLPSRGETMLLIETDGKEENAKREMDDVEKICLSSGAVKFDLASTKIEAEKLWEIRRSISPSLRKLSPTKINEDITVPRNRIADLMERLDRLSEKSGIPIVNFGHAGDGNIHVNVMTDQNKKDEYRLALEIVDEIFDITLELDGTISGEHGVGVAKKPYIAKELGRGTIEISKALKKAFDPDNILNPGKIFP
ncbi:MAG: FAD-binding protein [Nitrospinota bacterium]|nr:FAD-binding protein [Nitrospinota bacterium]